MRRWALASLATGALCAATAQAHVGHVIARAERYLKLDVAGHEARAVVSLTLGEEEGERVLREADADGDGQVEPAESDAYLARWGEGLAQELPLSVDSQRRELRWGEGYMSPIGPVRRAPVTLEMVARFTLDGGEQRLRLEDRMVRRQVFDRTDVAFRVRDGAELLSSGVDPGADPTLDLSYGPRFREGEPIPLHATVRTPETGPDPAVYAVGGGAAIALLVGLGIWRWRSRRK